MEYPKQNTVLILHYKSGRKSKGFFYMNGRRPTFASYGSDVTDQVIGWEYLPKEKKGE